MFILGVRVDHVNVYDDAERARAYATLQYPGTYYLGFRDLPRLFREHVTLGRALDFGCGAGRSTRFLSGLGFNATGIDISANMIREAQRIDPGGDYRLVASGEFSILDQGTFDLVFSAFAFDNIPGREERIKIVRNLAALLKTGGRMVILGSTPEIYWNEWVSFSTRDFPENQNARAGEQVKIRMKDVSDSRPVVDVIWFQNDYVELFRATGLKIIEEHRPLGTSDDGIGWLSETETAPWVIYVLENDGAQGGTRTRTDYSSNGF